MGCGESKHAVATENTLTKSKSKSKNVENNPPLEKATGDGNVNADEVQDSGIGNVKENEIPDAIKEEPQPDNGKETENAEEGKENPKKTDEKEKGIDDHGNGESGVEGKVEEREGKLEAAPVVVVEGNKEESKNEELKGEKEDYVCKKEEVEVGQEGQDRVISHDSPNHFFSPKKDHEETIESIISDGISGKSDYYSPRAKGNVSDGKVEGNDAVEGKEKDVEANSNKEKEEALKVDEGKESVPAKETKSSGEEKTPAKNENANAASTTDVKAN
ncbi:hypothetical protein Pfo_026092 [Paulownia fortunei]|nr:hypothetical protein Pfo_026092 [Paulownia fortunei]